MYDVRSNAEINLLLSSCAFLSGLSFERVKVQSDKNGEQLDLVLVCSLRNSSNWPNVTSSEKLHIIKT